MLKGDINKFIELFKSKKKKIILLHNNPDPDSIGSALGIKYIINTVSKSKVELVYGGIIGRAENQEMIRLLKIKLVHVNDIDLRHNKNIVMVDTQPGAGNNPLLECMTPKIVIDHHFFRKSTLKADFYDIRPDFGSSSTIVLEYIKRLGVKIDKTLATALFYGIKTDTDDIGRDRKKEDNDAIIELYPHVSPVILSKMEHPRIPVDYYNQFSEAMNNAYIFKDIIISDLKNKCTPDMIAEMSDFFLRMKSIRWVLCLGIYNNGIYFSIRTTSRSLRAGKIAIKISRGIGAAGGHYKSAGGYINISSKSQKQIADINDAVKSKFLKSIKRDGVPYKKIIL